jgi:hypothetical protein
MTRFEFLEGSLKRTRRQMNHVDQGFDCHADSGPLLLSPKLLKYVARMFAKWRFCRRAWREARMRFERAIMTLPPEAVPVCTTNGFKPRFLKLRPEIFE